MSATDRELLIGAAKAAGLDIDFSGPTPSKQIGWNEDLGCAVVVDWNPLSHGSHAFDLQVALKMDISYYGNHARATINHRYWAVALVHPDRKAATMRAIVLAAHKLGKDLQ